MAGLNPKMGQVVVEGRVFFADLYETRRPGVFCLTFDMTDNQTSVRVTKYLQKAEKDALKGGVKPGMWLQKLTTREPDDEMIEVGIAAVEAVFDWRAFLAGADPQDCVVPEKADGTEGNPAAEKPGTLPEGLRGDEACC